ELLHGARARLPPLRRPPGGQRLLLPGHRQGGVEMSLTMSGLDCHRTPLALREQLAFSGEGLRRALDHLRDQPGVTGCVLLSTCNRTELYLTGDSETPWRLLCRVAGVSE